MAAQRGADRRHTTAYLLVLVLLLAVAVTLPFALASVIADLRQDDEHVFTFGNAAPEHADYQVDVDITNLNDGEGTVTLRATATRGCLPACPEGARLAFVSAIIRAQRELLPVQEWLIFPPGIDTASSVLRLPVYGDPIRYPFDTWQLGLVIVPERVAPDGTLTPLRPDDSGGGVALVVESRVPRLQMGLGDNLVARYNVDLLGYQTLYQSFAFERPLYLKVLTVSLVLLVTAAAAYAVLLRPLDQLIINAGALVLGIWGVRAILLGTGLAVVTLVDLMLMSVILFLLAIITLRTLWLLEDRSQVRIFHRAFSPPQAEPSSRTEVSKDGRHDTPADFIPSAEALVERVPPVAPGG
jgi:hypothetical protein